MRKLLILISILFIAVIIAAVLYFRSLSNNSRSSNNFLTSIPADATFLLSFQNDKSFYNIFSDFEIFEAIIGKDAQHELNFLNKQILRKSDFHEQSNKQTLYFSFHPDREGINWLLTLPLKTRIKPEDAQIALEKALAGLGKLIPDSLTSFAYKIQLHELKKPFFIGFKDGIVFVSYKQELVQKSLDDKAAHLTASFVQELAKSEHKNNNSILNLHLNHTQLFQTINGLMRTKAGNNLQLLEGLKGMSSLNMNFKSDALMFSGLSTIENSTQNYIAIYTHQTATEGNLKQILPANTAAYASFAFSDYPKFHRELNTLLERRKQLNRIQDQLTLIRSSKKIDIDKDLLSQWSNEFASIELNTRENIGIVKLKDSLHFMESIDKISTGVSDEIRRFDNSNLLYYSFGDPMLPFQRPYFTVVNNYMICANTISTLQQFRKQHEQKELLINTIQFLEFNKLQANKANVSFYVNNNNSRNTLNRQLKPVYRKSYTDTVNFDYKSFYAFSFQLAGYDGNFYSNLSAKYISKEKETKQPEWETSLSSDINIAPTVWKYSDSTNFIVTQDKNNTLYGFTTEGKEIWRTSLSGKILGEIVQLTDHTILLNTEERLYRFKPDGVPYPGFPVVFPHKASYSSTIFQSDANYFKIFIPGQQHIFAYDNNGKELPEWKNKTVKGNILFGLKTALLNDFNYIIAFTEEGNIYLFNHNAGLTSFIEGDSKNEYKNAIGVEITPGKPEMSRIVTTDTSGVLQSFYFDKTKGQTSLGKWSGTHYFETKNIQGDSIKEFIITDNKQLYVFNSQDSTLLFNHTFNTNLTASPLYFPTENSRFIIGMATDAKLLYAFEDDGSIIKGFPMEGLPEFYYGKLKNNGHRYIILSKDGRKLTAYRMD